MTLVLSCLVPWGAWAVNTVPIEGHVYLQPDVPPPSTKVSLEVTWFQPRLQCTHAYRNRSMVFNAHQGLKSSLILCLFADSSLPQHR